MITEKELAILKSGPLKDSAYGDLIETCEALYKENAPLKREVDHHRNQWGKDTEYIRKLEAVAKAAEEGYVIGTPTMDTALAALKGKP